MTLFPFLGKCHILGMHPVKQEVFKHRTGFVILENVPIGICPRCGYRYYHAKLLYQVELVASHRQQVERMVSVPIATFAMA